DFCLGWLLALRVGHSSLWFQLVDLAIGRGGRVDHVIAPDYEYLNLEFLRLEDGCCFTLAIDPVDSGGRTCGRVDIPCIVGSNGPDIGRGTRIDRQKGRRQLQTSNAADGDSLGGSARQILEFRLFPIARGFGEGCDY